MIRVSARSLSGQPSLIRELRVKEGDAVKQGQILAVLDSREQLEAVLRQAEARVKVAQARLAQVKVGAKAADVEGQRSEIARLEAELSNATAEYARYQTLRQKEVVSASVLDAKRTRVETTTQALQQARDRLKSLSEVRQVDVDLAAVEVEAANSDVQRARAEYEATSVRSPINGRVVTIYAHPGEEVGTRGLAELAKTDQMYVIAEVFESDVARLKTGQRATITSESFAGEIYGVVEQIGLKVAKNELLQTDPAAFMDSRVVEVKIRLDDSKKVATLIHGKVNLLIKP
jgi:HlyD family secretion protein